MGNGKKDDGATQITSRLGNERKPLAVRPTVFPWKPIMHPDCDREVMENLDEVIRIGLRRSFGGRGTVQSASQSWSRDETVTIWAREFVEMAAISSQFVRPAPNLE